MAPSSPTRKLPEPGDVVAGKYRFVRRLGEGGMGVVYEAEHTRMHQRVAIKMLLPEILERPDLVSRFEREARAAGKLRSDYTTRVLDVDVTDGGMPYMVMEFLEGSDLGQILEQQKTLPIDVAVDFVLQACHAMAEAHAKGVVHRDLKPSNLFVTGARRVKVLDFGISKLENDEEARVTATQTAIGTPLYMSPEQIRSAKHVDARTDIWSLGVILFELLSGRTPFEGSTTAAAAAICLDAPPSLAKLRPDVPPELERAIVNALQKNVSDRWQSVQDLATAIAPFGSGAIAPIVPSATASTSGPVSIRGELASAPTLPVPSSRAVATLPGWSTRATQSTQRVRLYVAVVLGGVVLFFAGALAMRHRATAQPSAPIEPPAAALASSPAPVETVLATTVEPVPSPTVTAAPATTQRHVHSIATPPPHAPPPASTTPPHVPAPAPTRL